MIVYLDVCEFIINRNIIWGNTKQSVIDDINDGSPFYEIRGYDYSLSICNEVIGLTVTVFSVCFILCW